jgi:hypothetical protein
VAGQSSALVHDVPGAAEVLHRLVDEAIGVLEDWSARVTASH